MSLVIGWFTEFGSLSYQIINWARSTPDGVYMQWKPMCYTQRSKSINNARYTRNYGLHETRLNEDEAHLALAYFGNFSDVFFNVTHVSFGETDDEFYTATKYSTWFVLLLFVCYFIHSFLRSLFPWFILFQLIFFTVIVIIYINLCSTSSRATVQRYSWPCSTILPSKVLKLVRKALAVLK